VPKSLPQPNHRFSPSGITKLDLESASVGTWAWNQKCHLASESDCRHFLCNFQFSMQNMYWVFAIWEAGKL
jgi:hypothetical protein